MLGLARVSAFVRLGRPSFLFGTFVLFALGATVAAWAGATIDWKLYVLGQVSVTAFQSMTHYANDHFVYEADRANTTPTRWSGGSRVLAEQLLPRWVALAAALRLALVGVATSVYLGLEPKTGPWIAALLVLMLVLSWTYSAPPLQLHSSGLGELDVALVVTGLVPLTGFYLQAPQLAGLRPLLLALIPLCLLQFAMVVGVSFPDAAADAAVNKRTLVVRLGGARAAGLRNRPGLCLSVPSGVGVHRDASARSRCRGCDLAACALADRACSRSSRLGIARAFRGAVLLGGGIARIHVGARARRVRVSDLAPPVERTQWQQRACSARHANHVRVQARNRAHAIKHRACGARTTRQLENEMRQKDAVR